MQQPLEQLNDELKKRASPKDKLTLLNQVESVQSYLQKNPRLSRFLSEMPIETQIAAGELIAIGQMDRLLGSGPIEKKPLLELLHKVMAVDSFYKEIGGIIGYQTKILQFLTKTTKETRSDIAAFHAPDFIDISEESDAVREAIYVGLKKMPELAEMYPLAGAADRLHLVDVETGGELPAAKLQFAGRTLFEHLIRDLQAREFLYYKLFGTQIDTPIAIMTSDEKENHAHVIAICKEKKWFGRHEESYRLFKQPLVPAVDQKGNWYLLGRFSPLLKPGGHGAIWKLARDMGIFKWLKKRSCKKALIRQINNPIAGLDYGLLAFLGFGIKTNGAFGFASCSRLLQAAEGVNVVIEKKNGDVSLTNIEYCDFETFGIEDKPLKEGAPYSQFSSNTNILFADLKEIEKAVNICPFPGLLINLKNARQGAMARLESTMQNIADVFVEKTKPTKTFVTYNHRHKTIATAKKAYIPGGSLRETPEECFYVQLQSARKLLKGPCAFHLPPIRSLEAYLEKGPDTVFLYHPALGPFYHLIAQKIAGGSLGLGSEMQLDIADVQIENLQIEGSLLVKAEQILGHVEGVILKYSNQTGRCILKNVKVENRGVDWMKSRPFWKNEFQRFETMEVRLCGFSEFVAENVTFKGSFQINVPDGIRMRAEECNGQIVFKEEKLGNEAPFWTYHWDEKKGVRAAKE